VNIVSKSTVRLGVLIAGLGASIYSLSASTLPGNRVTSAEASAIRGAGGSTLLCERYALTTCTKMTAGGVTCPAGSCYFVAAGDAAKIKVYDEFYCGNSASSCGLFFNKAKTCTD
jgi:hypothetical protein